MPRAVVLKRSRRPVQAGGWEVFKHGVMGGPHGFRWDWFCDYGQTLLPMYSHDNPHHKTLGAKRQPLDKATMGNNRNNQLIY